MGCFYRGQVVKDIPINNFVLILATNTHLHAQSHAHLRDLRLQCVLDVRGNTKNDMSNAV